MMGGFDTEAKQAKQDIGNAFPEATILYEIEKHTINSEQSKQVISHLTAIQQIPDLDKRQQATIAFSNNSIATSMFVVIASQTVTPVKCNVLSKCIYDITKPKTVAVECMEKNPNFKLHGYNGTPEAFCVEQKATELYSIQKLGKGFVGFFPAEEIRSEVSNKNREESRDYTMRRALINSEALEVATGCLTQ